MTQFHVRLVGAKIVNTVEFEVPLAGDEPVLTQLVSMYRVPLDTSAGLVTPATIWVALLYQWSPAVGFGLSRAEVTMRRY